MVQTVWAYAVHNKLGIGGNVFEDVLYNTSPPPVLNIR